MLAYCGFVLMDAWLFQKAENRQLARTRLERQEAKRAATPGASPARPQTLPPASNGDLIGRIDIPRLGLSLMVVEGIGSALLRRAVGHIPGTALPGLPGNVGIAGHRDTFFRQLRNIRQRDIISLTTLSGEYRYRVVSTKVVSPAEDSVLGVDGNEILTLVTCYPFFFVGAAPYRFIVRAERSVLLPVATGEFPDEGNPPAPQSRSASVPEPDER
jgi:sortase A